MLCINFRNIEFDEETQISGCAGLVQNRKKGGSRIARLQSCSKPAFLLRFGCLSRTLGKLLRLMASEQEHRTEWQHICVQVCRSSLCLPKRNIYRYRVTCDEDIVLSNMKSPISWESVSAQRAFSNNLVHQCFVYST